MIGDSPLGKKETFGDTAAVLSRYVCAVTARVNSRDAIAGLADNSQIPVVNALDDWAHPMQILADMLTIEETKGGLAGVKMAYLGDIRNNMTCVGRPPLTLAAPQPPAAVCVCVCAFWFSDLPCLLGCPHTPTPTQTHTHTHTHNPPLVLQVRSDAWGRADGLRDVGGRPGRLGLRDRGRRAGGVRGAGRRLGGGSPGRLRDRGRGGGGGGHCLHRLLDVVRDQVRSEPQRTLSEHQLSPVPAS
eukprot:SAG22_NODE_478_length_9967_cov_12.777260_3_plen_244_part_00